MTQPQTFDWERVQGLTPLRDELPGELAPYMLSSGEGRRYDLSALHLATMASFSDTGDEYTLHRVILPAGSTSTFITVPSCSIIQVLEGELTICFDGKNHSIVAGQSSMVPKHTTF